MFLYFYMKFAINGKTNYCFMRMTSPTLLYEDVILKKTKRGFYFIYGVKINNTNIIYY